MMARRLAAILAAIFVVVASCGKVHAACDCRGFHELPPVPYGCNVDWFSNDSIAACPAGDTVVISGHPPFSHLHPSKLRFWVRYEDDFCQPKAGVPPESIWVTWSTASGDARIFDRSFVAYADDSTNSDGQTRITISGFSGDGTLRFKLYVSGVQYANVIRRIRTVDNNADGRVLSGESAVDINYDGNIDFWDTGVVAIHQDHWHRHALYGTLVRRTNLCDLCVAGGKNTWGEGRFSWSPNGRWMTYSIHKPDILGVCDLYIVPSDPKDGNTPLQYTSHSSTDSSDYDPSWSPKNDVVVFERGDRILYRKAVPWNGGAETAIYGSLTEWPQHPFVSPDGDSVGLAIISSGNFDLYTIPVVGGSRRRVTSTPDQDYFPSWRHDGKVIVFERVPSGTGYHHLYKVALAEGAAAPMGYYVPTNTRGRIPSYSPDSLVVVAAVGQADSTSLVATLEAAAIWPNVKALTSNYPTHKGGGPLWPLLSPDGTRLGIVSRDPKIPGPAALSAQLFAARRNMSLPPAITQVGTQQVADSTARVSFNVIRGLQSQFAMSSTDPEGDTKTCDAFFLRDGMSFSQSNCTLTWTPTVPVGTTYDVRLVVTTADGGTDAIILSLTVVAGQSPGRAVATSVGGEVREEAGLLELSSPPAAGLIARLAVFDLAGRRMATIAGPAGSRLVWNGRDRAGRNVPNGIYLYRLESGTYQTRGKVVVAR